MTYVLPSPHTRLSISVETGTSVQRMITRAIRRSGVNGKLMFAGTFSWTFLDDEFSEWLTWWQTDLVNGTLPFTANICTGASELPHLCQFISSYSIKRDTGVYEVSAEVKILTRPTGVPGSWDADLYGPPTLFPSDLVPSPQWGYGKAPEASFVATTGVSTAAQLAASRGVELDLSWRLDGTAFDYLVDWLQHTLAGARRKFVLSFPGIGPWVCQILSDPSLQIDGVDFQAKMTVQAVDRTVPSSVYLFDKDEGTMFDYITDVSEDVIADSLVDLGGS